MINRFEVKQAFYSLKNEIRHLYMLMNKSHEFISPNNPVLELPEEQHPWIKHLVDRISGIYTELTKPCTELEIKIERLNEGSPEEEEEKQENNDLGKINDDILALRKKFAENYAILVSEIVIHYNQSICTHIHNARQAISYGKSCLQEARLQKQKKIKMEGNKENRNENKNKKQSDIIVVENHYNNKRDERHDQIHEAVNELEDYIRPLSSKLESCKQDEYPEFPDYSRSRYKRQHELLMHQFIKMHSSWLKTCLDIIYNTLYNQYDPKTPKNIEDNYTFIFNKTNKYPVNFQLAKFKFFKNKKHIKAFDFIKEHCGFFLALAPSNNNESGSWESWSIENEALLLPLSNLLNNYILRDQTPYFINALKHSSENNHHYLLLFLKQYRYINFLGSLYSMIESGQAAEIVKKWEHDKNKKMIHLFETNETLDTLENEMQHLYQLLQMLDKNILNNPKLDIPDDQRPSIKHLISNFSSLYQELSNQSSEVSKIFFDLKNKMGYSQKELADLVKIHNDIISLRKVFLERYAKLISSIEMDFKRYTCMDNTWVHNTNVFFALAWGRSWLKEQRTQESRKKTNIENNNDHMTDFNQHRLREKQLNNMRTFRAVRELEDRSVSLVDKIDAAQRSKHPPFPEYFRFSCANQCKAALDQFLQMHVLYLNDCLNIIFSKLYHQFTPKAVEKNCAIIYDATGNYPSSFVHGNFNFFTDKEYIKKYTNVFTFIKKYCYFFISSLKPETREAWDSWSAKHESLLATISNILECYILYKGQIPNFTKALEYSCNNNHAYLQSFLKQALCMDLVNSLHEIIESGEANKIVTQWVNDMASPGYSVARPGNNASFAA